jgi:transmembrane sensor
MAGAAVPQAIARRAVEWMVELQSPPVADELLREWQLWLASDPDHQRAWQRIEAVNDRLRGLGNGPQHPAVTAALLAPRGSPGRRQAVKALSVAIFTGTLAWTAEQQLPWRTWTADQRTFAGQRRTLALADGTRVALNTGTALNIDYDGSARRLAKYSSPPPMKRQTGHSWCTRRRANCKRWARALPCACVRTPPRSASSMARWRCARRGCWTA